MCLGTSVTLNREQKEPQMNKVAKSERPRKSKTMGTVDILTPEQYQPMALDVKAELIQALIPLGLMHVSQVLQQEVQDLAGPRYARSPQPKALVRYGANPSSVRLGGQRVPIRAPRVRNQHTGQEVRLQALDALQQQPNPVDETLFKRVLYGISCRNYEAAAESIPGAIGLSASSVSRQFVHATAKRLREFQERDLSGLDLVALWLDGKSFAQDTMVIAMGLTLEGRKVPLGFVQTGTENKSVLSAFVRQLQERGLRSDAGLLVVIDGSKGLRAAVQEVFADRALVQRCQWHKRENVVAYLPKSEQAAMRKRLQKAYGKATYAEASKALKAILHELEQRNASAAASLAEALEETLTLHRLGVFERLGISLKTTNAMESVMSLVEARCGKVSCWKNSSQKARWLAASLLDIEPRLRRVRGYRHLPELRAAIHKALGLREAKSVA